METPDTYSFQAIQWSLFSFISNLEPVYWFCIAYSFGVNNHIGQRTPAGRQRREEDAQNQYTHIKSLLIRSFSQSKLNWWAYRDLSPKFVSSCIYSSKIAK